MTISGTLYFRADVIDYYLNKDIKKDLTACSLCSTTDDDKVIVILNCCGRKQARRRVVAPAEHIFHVTRVTRGPVATWYLDCT